MFKSLDVSTTMFKKKPLNFIVPTIYWVILRIVYLFSLFAILYILFIGSTLLNVRTNQGIWLALFGIIFLVFTFWDSGLKASFIHAYSNGIHRRTTIFMEFFTFGKKYRTKIFTVQILRMIVIGLLMFPSLALYLYVPAVNQLPYINIVMILIFVTLCGFISYLTFPSTILITVKNLSVSKGLKRGLQYLRRNPFESLTLYIIYGVTKMVDLIPLFNIISLLLVLPVIYSGLISALEKY